MVFTDAERRGVLAAMGEVPPWDARLDLSAVKRAPFPKLVVSGGWNPALDAVADELERRLGAERVKFPGVGHTVQGIGKPFNDALVDFWPRAEVAHLR